MWLEKAPNNNQTPQQREASEDKGWPDRPEGGCYGVEEGDFMFL